jgi:hypothetical protein
MNRLTEKKSFWRLAVIVLALLTVLQGFFFAWSNRYVSLVIALALSGLAWFRPKTSALLFAFWALLCGAGLLYASSLTKQAPARGTPRAEVHRALGEPDYTWETLQSMRPFGYSEPSPLRYDRNLPVEVFISGDHATWLFYKNEKVADVYVGGS